MMIIFKIELYLNKLLVLAESGIVLLYQGTLRFPRPTGINLIHANSYKGMNETAVNISQN